MQAPLQALLQASLHASSQLPLEAPFQALAPLPTPGQGDGAPSLPAPAADPVCVIGAGPAGLMAAEVIRAGGRPVAVFDTMPSVARKFLLAGKGGLNITHAEPLPQFLARYGPLSPQLAQALDAFGPARLRDWVHALGIETFVGSSGRVFPSQMKAAPLLRAWLHRLRGAGVTFHMRQRWTGWAADGRLSFLSAAPRAAAAVVLATGGGSWPRLGSDGAWVPLLRALGADVAPLIPANCGFDVDWSGHFSERFAGQPVKAVCAWPDDQPARAAQGEFVITSTGIEGSLVYQHAARLRDRLMAGQPAALALDLAPGRDLERLVQALSLPRSGRSLANHLRVRAGLQGVKAGLVRERGTPAQWNDPRQLAALIKRCPLPLRAPRPLDEVISSAGGVAFAALDAALMLQCRPGVFCAGEMLDWEAPTGGYLLTASMATGRLAGQGVLRWLGRAG